MEAPKYDRIVEELADEAYELNEPEIYAEFALDDAVINGQLIADWQQDLDEVKETVKLQRERLTRWAEAEEERLQKRINWHLRLVQQYMARAEKKTLKLPAGTAKRTAGREKVEIAEPERFVELHLGDNDDLLKTKIEVTPDKKAIMGYIKKEGEIPNGCDLVRGDETVSFKASK